MIYCPIRGNLILILSQTFSCISVLFQFVLQPQQHHCFSICCGSRLENSFFIISDPSDFFVFFNCLFCVFCLCELPCVGDISMLYVQDTAVSLCDCRVAGCSLSSFAAVKATSTCCSMLSCRTVPLPDFTALMIREMFKPFRCSMQAFQNALAS